jgi:small subunit ribosomal protein S14
MSSISIRTLDKIKRYNYNRSEFYFFNSNILTSDTHLSLITRYSISLHTKHFSYNNYAVRICNRCILSGRSRGNFNTFKITRMIFKKFSTLGLLPGIKKSSW